ncbi:putative cytochrome p450 6a1 [Rosellinia necatrix]|uniref:Putative cytochrome p450 6a1 n=1 Tax=Rosellinia necatrix TaxID=77044 RepID=A0A1S7UMG1_ROSNE|nr:putative cytochrome p450 6a1 [Rosellinia necatrix]
MISRQMRRRSDLKNGKSQISLKVSTFTCFKESTNVAHTALPWLIIPKYVARFIATIGLYITAKRIFKARSKSGRQSEDALQFFYDQQGGFEKFIMFSFSALPSSMTMTGTAMIWLSIFLADSPKWQEECHNEVESTISQHRKTRTQSREDILASLPLNNWESSFPTLQACLHEALRIMSMGVLFRQNVSGGDILIGSTGDVVPDGSYAAYLPDYVHMDPSLYPKPFNFDPARFLGPGGRNKSVPHSFLGWGSGRYSCPGMRLAKLNINILFIYLLANFEFETSDKQGRSKVGVLGFIDRDEFRPEKPHAPIYIRYRPRSAGTTAA